MEDEPKKMKEDPLPQVPEADKNFLSWVAEAAEMYENDDFDISLAKNVVRSFQSRISSCRAPDASLAAALPSKEKFFFALFATLGNYPPNIDAENDSLEDVTAKLFQYALDTKCVSVQRVAGETSSRLVASLLNAELNNDTPHEPLVMPRDNHQKFQNEMRVLTLEKILNYANHTLSRPVVKKFCGMVEPLSPDQRVALCNLFVHHNFSAVVQSDKASLDVALKKTDLTSSHIPPPVPGRSLVYFRKKNAIPAKAATKLGYGTAQETSMVLINTAKGVALLNEYPPSDIQGTAYGIVAAQKVVADRDEIVETIVQNLDRLDISDAFSAHTVGSLNEYVVTPKSSVINANLICPRQGIFATDVQNIPANSPKVVKEVIAMSSNQIASVIEPIRETIRQYRAFDSYKVVMDRMLRHYSREGPQFSWTKKFATEVQQNAAYIWNNQAFDMGMQIHTNCGYHPHYSPSMNLMFELMRYIRPTHIVTSRSALGHLPIGTNIAPDSDYFCSPAVLHNGEAPMDGEVTHRHRSSRLDSEIVVNFDYQCPLIKPKYNVANLKISRTDERLPFEFKDPKIFESRIQPDGKQLPMHKWFPLHAKDEGLRNVEYFPDLVPRKLNIVLVPFPPLGWDGDAVESKRSDDPPFYLVDFFLPMPRLFRACVAVYSPNPAQLISLKTSKLRVMDHYYMVYINSLGYYCNNLLRKNMFSFHEIQLSKAMKEYGKELVERSKSVGRLVTTADEILTTAQRVDIRTDDWAQFTLDPEDWVALDT